MAKKPKNVVGWEELDRRHKAAMAKKKERIDMWEEIVKWYDTVGRGGDAYVRDLRVRLRSEKTQYRAMKP